MRTWKCHVMRRSVARRGFASPSSCACQLLALSTLAFYTRFSRLFLGPTHHSLGQHIRVADLRATPRIFGTPAPPLAAKRPRFPQSPVLSCFLFPFYISRPLCSYSSPYPFVYAYYLPQQRDRQDEATTKQNYWHLDLVQNYESCGASLLFGSVGTILRPVSTSRSTLPSWDTVLRYVRVINSRKMSEVRNC